MPFYMSIRIIWFRKSFSFPATLDFWPILITFVVLCYLNTIFREINKVKLLSKCLLAVIQVQSTDSENATNI